MMGTETRTARERAVILSAAAIQSRIESEGVVRQIERRSKAQTADEMLKRVAARGASRLGEQHGDACAEQEK